MTRHFAEVGTTTVSRLRFAVGLGLPARSSFAQLAPRRARSQNFLERRLSER